MLFFEPELDCERSRSVEREDTSVVLLPSGTEETQQAFPTFFDVERNRRRGGGGAIWLLWGLFFDFKEGDAPLDLFFDGDPEGRTRSVRA